jgi:hypothetical protein
MKLPNGDSAIVDPAKLRDYCLNPDHFRGQHKARVFRLALGIGPEGTDWLRIRLLEAAQQRDALRGSADSFGQRYVIDFPLRGLSGHVKIRSCWIIRTGERRPRLTTCFIL